MRVKPCPTVHPPPPWTLNRPPARNHPPSHPPTPLHSERYVLGMFCGFIPLCLPVMSLTGNAGAGNYRLASSESNACYFSSKNMVNPDPPLCEATPSSSSLGKDITNDSNVYKSPGSTGGTPIATIDSRPRKFMSSAEVRAVEPSPHVLSPSDPPQQSGLLHPAPPPQPLLLLRNPPPLQIAPEV